MALASFLAAKIGPLTFTDVQLEHSGGTTAASWGPQSANGSGGSWTWTGSYPNDTNQERTMEFLRFYDNSNYMQITLGGETVVPDNATANFTVTFTLNG